MFHEASNIKGNHEENRHSYGPEDDLNMLSFQPFGEQPTASSSRTVEHATAAISLYQEENDSLEIANVWSEPSISDFDSLGPYENPVSNSTEAWMLRHRKRTTYTDGTPSAGHDNISQTSGRRNSTHRRHATENSIVAEQSFSRASAVSHPLQTPIQAAFSQSESALGLDLDVAVTRPTLRRLLSAGEFGHTHKSTGDYPGSVKAGEDTVEVIIHEVSAIDSFAGVALRYGISVADLRRVNQLWASDSIHLRKILYIPLSLLSKGKGKARNMDCGSDNITRTNSTDDESVNDVYPQSDVTVEGGSTFRGFPIHRVHASQLGFFPNNGQSKSTQRGRLKQIPHNVSLRPPPSFSAPSSRTRLSPHGKTLSALLNAIPRPIPLPIPLLSDDSRQSLDSSSLQSTSPSGESESAALQTHEMDVLRPRSRPHTGSRRLSRDDSAIKTYVGNGVVGVDSDEEGAAGESYILKTPKQRRKRSTSLPRSKTREYSLLAEGSDGDADAPAIVRTQQLQPSPNMRLPR